MLYRAQRWEGSHAGLCREWRRRPFRASAEPVLLAGRRVRKRGGVEDLACKVRDTTTSLTPATTKRCAALASHRRKIDRWNVRREFSPLIAALEVKWTSRARFCRKNRRENTDVFSGTVRQQDQAGLLIPPT